MNFRTDAHHTKDRRVRGLAAALTAAAGLTLAPALASAQGVDQYRPSDPPRPGPSAPAGGDGSGSGLGTGSPPPSTGTSVDAGSVESGSVPSASSPDSGDGGVATSEAPGGSSSATAREDGKVKVAEADPLSVADLRPAAALGAQVSPGGIGTLPLLLGGAAILTGIGTVARRGVGRSGQGTG